LDNIELIRKAKKEGEDDDGDDEEAPQTGSNKRARTQGGRITKGEDFWGKVDSFFVEMIDAHGLSLVGSHWKE